MDSLLNEIRECTICKSFLPNKPRPIIQASSQSRIVIIGQAPGQKVQDSGIPWNDASGKELRRWLGINETIFYNPEAIALIPMGFCYPGKGNSGDLPPRPECASQWHQKLFSSMKNIKLTLLIGQYSQSYYLPPGQKLTLTETVKNFKKYLPQYFPLVHPSPRNRIWQKKNPWFEKEVVPFLQNLIKKIL